MINDHICEIMMYLNDVLDNIMKLHSSTSEGIFGRILKIILRVRSVQINGDFRNL